MFQTALFINQMEYQHVAIDQYARGHSPNIPAFVMYDSSVNPDVTLDYSQVAFRFGHSQLREVIDTLDPNGSLTAAVTHYSLEQAFLDPAGFAKVGPGAIAQGMSRQVASELDEFVTPALQQKLLGQPQDLFFDVAQRLVLGDDASAAGFEVDRVVFGEDHLGLRGFGVVLDPHGEDCAAVGQRQRPADAAAAAAAAAAGRRSRRRRTRCPAGRSTRACAASAGFGLAAAAADCDCRACAWAGGSLAKEAERHRRRGNRREGSLAAGTAR
jgi:hypothetical protein